MIVRNILILLAVFRLSFGGGMFSFHEFIDYKLFVEDISIELKFDVDTIHFLVEISYNQPDLSACAEWKLESIILPTEPSENYEPMSVFVDKNNTIYVTYPYPYNGT